MLACELPVYIDTYQLVDIVTEYASEYPKMYKYSLGQKIISVSLELFEYLLLANMTTDPALKSKYLQGFQIKHELLKVLIRLSFDKRILNSKQSARLATLNEKIGKQITGWKKSTSDGRSQ